MRASDVSYLPYRGGFVARLGTRVFAGWSRELETRADATAAEVSALCDERCPLPLGYSLVDCMATIRTMGVAS